MAIQLVPDNVNIQFIQKRMFFFMVSGLILLSGLIMGISKGINWGIDFKGGFVLNIRPTEKIEMSDLRQRIGALGLGDVTFKEVGSAHDVMITVEKQPGDEKAQMAALEKIKDALGPNVEYRSVDTVGPKASEDLLYNGLQAVFFSLLAMLIYVAIRFQWKFGLSAIIALLHDAFLVISFYVFTGLDFNMPAILAVLVTVGYSINDTVVIFDRIRENQLRYNKLSIPEMINKSINETLARTTITSGTTICSLVCLYVFGGEVISTYSLPILVGVIVGTYSSICIAGPVLSFFDITPKSDDEVEGFKPSANAN